MKLLSGASLYRIDHRGMRGSDAGGTWIPITFSLTSYFSKSHVAWERRPATGEMVSFYKESTSPEKGDVPFLAFVCSIT